LVGASWPEHRGILVVNWFSQWTFGGAVDYGPLHEYALTLFALEMYAEQKLEAFFGELIRG
jgi:hypothetical protein